ncbi:type I polyketide synthase [Desulfoplanes formicivorans]|uniref:Type I polyketide synthase n=1 Tax=Desulfoplanes formicivorans TaxID=1592317 RepID=A0A194AEX4_9BACT|nr:type I polyketide synthase [Desulfoplanes formicivorans]GAU08622.1 type I polyketide synthase [Desulfoplanes formicivorans]
MTRYVAVFSGIGTQWPGMGRELMVQGGAFAAGFREFDQAFAPMAGWSVEQMLYTQSGDIRPAHMGHPCVLAVECGLFRALQESGFEPDMIMGHSGGEVTAAWAAGVLSTTDAARVALAHSQLLVRVSGQGRMAFVGLPADNVERMIQPYNDRVQIAAINAPSGTVCSGDPKALQALGDACPAHVFFRMLAVDVPFHSKVIEAHLKEFAESLATLTPQPARIPILSSLHGKVARPGDFDAAYWCRHIGEPVRFEAAMRCALDRGAACFVEIAPHAVLQDSMAETASAMGHRVESTGTMCRNTDASQTLQQATDILKGWKEAPSACSGISDAHLGQAADKSRRRRRSELKKLIRQELKQVLPECEMGDDEPFRTHGLTSLLAVRFCSGLGQSLGLALPVSTVFNHPDITRLADHLSCLGDDVATGSGESVSCKHLEEPLAVVGVGCRLPGGINSMDEYWRFLVDGKDAVIPVPQDRWDRERYYDPDRNAPGKMYTCEAAFLTAPSPRLQDFDAHFFNISSREAAQLDPQQRLLLEVSWEAFEHAGIDPFAWRGKNVGVFVGMTNNEYSHAHRESYVRERIDAYSLTGTTLSGACGRVSYYYGFEGPCFSVDTACSSSMVALHAACRSLRQGESDMALVGGVTLMLTPDLHICFSKLGAISPDGRSKAFDDSADGYGRGEGAVVVLLKRLRDAQRDKDRILGLVRGTALNQDGKSNGLTSPNGLSQQKVIAQALRDAALRPEDVSYVEAHGTGTALGDAIELEALADAYRPSPGTLLRIGSVKANIGHLEPVSALASLAKLMLCLEHGALPANIHIKTPNTRFDWQGRGVEAPRTLQPWEGEHPRRAGMSSFGFSGVNGHAIIEEYVEPAVEESTQEPSAFLLLLSAKTEEALRDLAQATALEVQDMTPHHLAALCRSAACRRHHFAWRVAVVGSTPGEVAEQLRTAMPVRAAAQPETMGLLFTGQGSQYPDMGRSLFAMYPVFRKALEECDLLLQAHDFDLLQAIYGGMSAEELARTEYAQPVIASVSYALWRLWESFGLGFDYVAGHSIGEYPAAVASGVMRLEDMLVLALHRGRCMAQAPSGGMAAVFASEDEVAGLLAGHPQICIAAINAPVSLTVSGPQAALAAFLKDLKDRGVAYRELRVSHAFHSPDMDKAAKAFEGPLQEVELARPTRMDMISTVSGQMASLELTRWTYWRDQIVAPVRFFSAVQTMSEQCSLAVEAGPSTALSGLVWQCGLTLQCFPTLSPKQDGLRSLFGAMASLYGEGVVLNWDEVFASFPDQYVPLPGYPWQRQQHWMDVQVDPPSGFVRSDHVPGHRLDSPALGDSAVFVMDFSETGPGFVQEHVIFGKAISPAAGHMAMILAAVRELRGTECCQLGNVDFLSPLVVEPGQTRHVQVIIETPQASESRFRLVSRQGEEDWLTHCTGTVIFQPGPESVPVRKPGQLFAHRETKTAFYDRFLGQGYEVGPGFQRIEDISVRDGESMCRVQARRGDPGEAGHVIYPGALDAVLQTILPPFFHELADTMMTEEALLIPLHVERLSLWRPVPEALWCHARARRGSGDATLEGGTLAMDDKGQVVMELSGFVFRMTDRATLYRQMHSDPLQQVYVQQWDDAQLPKAGSGQVYVASLGRAETGARLAEVLGAHVLPTSGRELARALADVDTSGGHLLLVHGPCSDVDDLAAGEIRVCQDMLVALQQAVSFGLRVHVITSGVMKVLEDDEVQPSGAGLWGVGGSFALEHPDLWGGCVDMPGTAWSDEDMQLCARLCQAESVQDHRAVRHGRVYAQSLVHLKSDRQADAVPLSGTHVISGGSGSLGLHLARWLGDKGAEAVALMSRSGIRSESGRQALEDLRQKGVRVFDLQVDVTDVLQVEAALTGLRQEAPPLRGVYHAAGLLDDGVIMEMTPKRMHKVMEPKITGAVNLHLATRDDELQHFVLYSSAGTLLGAQGQSNYNAANLFFNVFAWWRQQQGLAGNSVCWGPWAEGGMAVATKRRGAHLERQGIVSLQADDALAAFQAASPLAPCFGVMHMDWKRFAQARSESLQQGSNGYFASLISTQWLHQDDMQNVEAVLGDATDAASLLEGLRLVACRLIGVSDPAHLAVEVPLLEQGFDSLLAVEFRNIIGRELGRTIPVSLIFEYPTLEKIAGWLRGSNGSETEEQIPVEIANVDHFADRDRQALLNDIDSLLGED